MPPNLLQREDLNSADFSNDFSLANGGVRIKTSVGSSVAAAIAAAAPTGAETKVTGVGVASVSGTGTAADPYIVNVPAPSGSETKIVGAGNASISGTGVAGDPYTINVPAPTGTETVVTAGSNITVTGTGAAGDPYVVSAVGGATGLLAVTHDATMTGDGTAGSPLSVVVATEALKGIVELASTTEAAAGTSTTLAVTPAGLAAYVAANVTGAETKVTAGTNVVVTGNGTTSTPYSVNVPVATNTLAGVSSLAVAASYPEATNDTEAATPAYVAAAIAAIPAADGSETKVTAGTNVTVTGSGTTAAPYVVNVPAATDTLAGAVPLAVAANYPSPTNDTDAATPAYVAAAIAAIPVTPDIVTTLALSGVNYVYTNEAAVQTVINPAQFVSSDAGNGIGLGADGRLKVLIPAQLPDDQVLTGDNSGNVSITLTPVTDPGTGNTNYTILANLKAAATNPSGGTNPLVVGSSGWYIGLKDCAGNYHALDAQIPTCAEMNAAIAAAAPTGAETKVTAGTNVTVTGTGTTADPYVVNSSGGGSTPDGSETKVTAGPGNTLVYGSGTTADPYVVEGPAFATAAQVQTGVSPVTMVSPLTLVDTSLTLRGLVNLQDNQALGDGAKSISGAVIGLGKAHPQHGSAVFIQPGRDYKLFENTNGFAPSMGNGSIALSPMRTGGAASPAVDYGASAPGDAAVAIGNAARAEGMFSAAFGQDAHATGLSSTAIGGGAATGEASVAIRGDATGFGAASLGEGALSAGVGAVAILYGKANGLRSLAAGAGATATGTQSLAMSTGVVSTAIASGSIALMGSTTITGKDSVSISRLSSTGGLYSTAIAGGTTSNTGHDAFSGGLGAQATGQASICFGMNSRTVDAAIPALVKEIDPLASGVLSSTIFGRAQARYAFAAPLSTVAAGHDYSQAYGRATTTKANQVYIAGATMTEVRSDAPIFAPAFTISSDARVKRNVGSLDLAKGKAFLKQLRFVQYEKIQNQSKLDREHQNQIALLESSLAAGADLSAEDRAALNTRLQALKLNPPKAVVTHKEFGVIAQELKPIADAHGFGWLVSEDTEGYLSVDYNSLYALATAVLIASL